MITNHENIPIPPPKSPWWPLFVVGAGVIGVLLLIRWAALTPVRPQAGGTAQAFDEKEAITWVIEQESKRETPAAEVEAHPDPEHWDRLIDAARKAVDSGRADVRRFVSTLFAALDDRTPADRLAILGRFFESGADVDLRLPFVPGTDGTLTSWPTLRVALFDYLASRDAEAVHLLAEGWIEARPGRPAEWAVALRELTDEQDASTWSPAIRACVRVILTDEMWSKETPPGWAEALDVIAAGKAVEYLPHLSRLTDREHSRDAQYAAHAALHGLMRTAPTEVLEALNRDTSLLSNSTGVRAGLVARADVRVPEQLSALETYLGRPDVMAGERAQFTAQFPHHLTSASPRLLTSMRVQTPEEIQAQDEATIGQIVRWMEDPRFEEWRGGLVKVRDRLNSRLNVAER